MASAQNPPAAVTLYGAPYSVYVRIARLVLEEAGVDYDLVPVDVFEPDSWPPGYAERHPFGKIPAFEHAGFRLYEADAIAHYAITAFEQPQLLPEEAEARARAIQIMRIVDNYAYPRLVWGVYVPERESTADPGQHGPVDNEAIEKARHCLAVLEGLMEEPYFLRETPTLADLWLLPVLTYLRLAASGPGLLSTAPKLSDWLDRIADRPSVIATRFPNELEQA